MIRANLVLSAEHAGRKVPRRWAALFAGHEELLSGHRGWDAGSLELARALHRATSAPLLVSEVTRLLADCNRSPGSKGLFSELTRGLPPSEREMILARHHAPHRAAVAAAVTSTIERSGRALHLAVHSFTPVFCGRVRDVDVGLLFDPRRPAEARFARRWREELLALEPDLRVRLNRPYRGWTDGLCTTLRLRLPASRYLGLELELNQAFPLGEAAAWRRLQRALTRSLTALPALLA